MKRVPIHQMATDTDLANEEAFDEEAIEDESLDLSDEALGSSSDEDDDSDADQHLQQLPPEEGPE